MQTVQTVQSTYKLIKYNTSELFFAYSVQLIVKFLLTCFFKSSSSYFILFYFTYFVAKGALLYQKRFIQDLMMCFKLSCNRSFAATDSGHHHSLTSRP